MPSNSTPTKLSLAHVVRQFRRTKVLGKGQRLIK